MGATLIDTNVLIDIAVRDPVWAPWSRQALAAARKDGPLVINQIVFSEFSLRYSSLEEVEAILPHREFTRESLPWESAFAAARAFLVYCRRGGIKDRPLPDFFIGAHAAIRGYPILTRDPSGYRSYFPMVPLITPDICA